jgi:aldose 1-epimerase
MEIIRHSLDSSSETVRVVFSDGSLFEFLNIGATLTRWITADGTHLVAAYGDYQDYREGGMYFGTTVGLTAGRIRQGKCVVQGKPYVFTSRAKNFLHGGEFGLSFSAFVLESLEQATEEAILTYQTIYRHPFMPGNVTVRVRYTVRPCQMRIEFFAEAEAVALVNLTNHSYFNLEGRFSENLSSHRLRLRASEVVLVDEEVVGLDPVKVEGTLFDFREPRPLMPAILDPLLQNQTAKGLDHYFLFDRSLPRPDLVFVSDRNHKVLEIDTSYPGVTIYSTNYPGKKRLATGGQIARHSALAIEPQYQSNGINDPRFFSLILEPHVPYHQTIEYRLIEK